MTRAPDGERGMAFVAVMLMMVMMSMLAAVMSMGGRTELALATNENHFAGTRAAAEAGLNHGIVVVLAATAGTGLSGMLRGPDGVVNAGTPASPVNADNGSLVHLIGGTPPWIVSAIDPRYTYDVRVVDDDDPSLYETALTAAQLTALGEDGSGVTDVNGKYVIRSWGFGPGGTTAEVEMMLLPATLPALLVNGTLTMSGTAKILGTAGSVHANTNLTISASAVSVAKNATASATYTKPANWKPGGTGAGATVPIAVPNISASDYRTEPSLVDLVLTSTGLIKNAAGATVCTASTKKTNCKSSYGWQFSSASAGWTMNNSTGVAATYYVEGPAIVSASPGTSSTPMRMSIIATGSITISGSPKLAAEASSGLLFVTSGDLRITGSLTQSGGEARILVREQIQLSGATSLNAQVQVQNVASVSTVVTTNTMSSSSKITYNAIAPALTYTAGGWREGP